MLNSEKLEKKSLKNQNQKPFNIGRYSGLAFEMLTIMLIGVFGGIKLDELLKIKFPLFTILLSLFSVFTAIYLAIKDLIKK